MNTPDLFGIGNAAGLADDSNLHLSGIGHLVLDLRGDIGTEGLGLGIVHLVGTDDDTELTACLDGIGLRDTGISVRPTRSESLRRQRMLFVPS